MVIAWGALFPDLFLTESKRSAGSNTSIMACMILAYMVTLAANTWQLFISSAYVGVK